MKIRFLKVGSRLREVGSRQATVGSSLVYDLDFLGGPITRACLLPTAYCLLFLLSFLCSYHATAQKAIPELWGQRVHDEAHVLTTETIDQLEKDLKLYEDSTSNQVAILIIQSLDGEVIEDYSLKVVEKWKLGTKSKDNGVLLLIAIDEHKMRIEVGHGLEGVLTDALSSRIIRNEMAPNFRRGDYDEGVLAAIEAIKKSIGGEYTADDSDGASISDFDSMDTTTKILIACCLFLFLSIFAGIGLFSQGGVTWILYAFLMPFYAVFLGLLFSWWIFLGYILLYPLLRWWIVKSGKKLMKWQSTGGGFGNGWSSRSSRSSWGSSGSSRSFSGGGGSFGGGGSSGGW
jgi:uncharacterized protein